MPTRSRHRFLLLMAGLLFMAFALRLYRLDYQSIWWDEGISLHLGTSSFGDIIRDRQNNIHPPLYFFILKAWLSLVGVSAFTGRYLSVLAGLLQVAIVYAAVRFWSRSESGWGGFGPWLAAALVLISPLSVIYSQEIRVYAMLPLVYMAILLLAEASLSPGGMKHSTLVWLALAEWTGLHLHYVAIFGVAYIGLWGLASLTRRRDREGMTRWIKVQGVVVLLSLPWIMGVFANWTAINAEANAGTYLTEPVPITYLIAQVWAFHLTGLAGALVSRFVQVGAALAAALLAGLLVGNVALSNPPAKGATTSRLLAHWIVPLAAGFALWSVRSFSHPRYIIMFAIVLWPLVALLAGRARRPIERLMSGMLIVCLIALSFWGLRQYFFESSATKPDIRGAARYLESIAVAGDLIIIPDTDWSFPFEYNGQAAVMMPGFDRQTSSGGSALDSALACLDGTPCAHPGRVFVLDYADGTRDWQSELPFELAGHGFRLSEKSFEDVRVREYRITTPSVPAVDCGSLSPRLDIRLGSLQLESAWVVPQPASDTAVAVALCWRAIEQPAADYSSSLILRDPVTGERIGQADKILVNRYGSPTRFWSPDDRVVTYHVVPLPVGTPPIEAQLSTGLYLVENGSMTPVEGVDNLGRPIGEIVPLSDVVLGAPIGLSDSPYGLDRPPGLATPIEVAEGLRLVGMRFNPGPYRPGENVRVGLVWQATTDPMPDHRPALVLEQDGSILAENADQMVNGRYPITQWNEQSLVLEYRDMRVPAGVEGVVQLVLLADGNRFDLGEVTVEGADVLFDRPAMATSVEAQFGDGIALIGADMTNDTIHSSGPIDLTLYWQSLSGEISNSYTVFTHLLAEDGHLIAQHDGLPANGQRPTDEWLAGEFVIDPHSLIWRDPSYTGLARVAVGLYDSATGERLQLAGGSDSFYLPQTITITKAE